MEPQKQDCWKHCPELHIFIQHPIYQLWTTRGHYLKNKQTNKQVSKQNPQKTKPQNIQCSESGIIIVVTYILQTFNL